MQEPVPWALACGRKAFTVVTLKTENMSALPERMTRQADPQAGNISLLSVLLSYLQLF